MQTLTGSQSLADLGSGDETRGDCRVDVTPRDVADGLSHGGHSQTEAQRDPNHVVCLMKEIPVVSTIIWQM